MYASRQSNSTSDDQNIIQEEAAQWEMYIGICKSVPAIISNIFFGSWSDRVGRKKILILPVIGDFLNAVCYWLCAFYFSAPIFYLFIGNAISALFGNHAAVLMSVYAYVSDLTTEATRTKRVILLESMTYLGSVISNLTGGLMLERYGFVPVYSLIVFLYALLAIYLIFLKESLPLVNNEAKKVANLLSKQRLFEALSVVTKRRTGRYRMSLFLLLGCFFFLVLLFNGINSITVFFVLHSPLSFTSSQIGYLFTEINGVRFVGATIINLLFFIKLQVRDCYIIMLAALTYSGFTFMLGMSTTPLLVFLAPLWSLGEGGGVASTRAGLSKMVGKSEQGKLFSIVACLEVCVALVSSTIFNTIYRYTVRISPSFTFFVMSGMAIVPLALALISRSMSPREQYNSDDTERSNPENQGRSSSYDALE